MSKTITTVSALFLALVLSTQAFCQGSYISTPDRKFTSVNQVGIMINNNGYMGTNLPNAQSPPSFEYPLGTDIERMIRGGIWIGAINADNDHLVSTATLDESYSSQDLAEYVEGPLIEERSTLANNRYFHPDAISEQDFVLFFDDSDSTRWPGHHPLPVRVDLETYAWSFQPVDQMVILSYTITNMGQRTLDSVYIGVYAELISCSKAFDTSFPGDCFDTKLIEFDTQYRMMANTRYDQNSLLPGWGGFSILGSSPDSIVVNNEEVKTITYEWWPWDPDSAESATDFTRFTVMSSGIVDPPVVDNGTSSSPDPVSIISTGPYRFLEPDSSITVVFAALGGRDWDDLLFRADWAQQTYDAGYLIPLPPPSPGLIVDPGPNSVRLFWDDFPEFVIDPIDSILDFEGYRIYMSRDNIDFVQVAEFDLIDSVGYNIGLDSIMLDTTIIVPSDTGDVAHECKYSYEIPSLKDGFEYFVSVTSFDRGNEEKRVPSLESGISQNRTISIPGPNPTSGGGDGPAVVVFPNPYHGEAVWDGQFDRERLIYFGNLPARCTIRIYTLAGDFVDQIDFDSKHYHGQNAAAIYDSDFDAPQLSGGLAAWDLLSERDQAIASGLYIFSVQNHDGGDPEVGKFLVIR